MGSASSSVIPFSEAQSSDNVKQFISSFCNELLVQIHLLSSELYNYEVSNIILLKKSKKLSYKFWRGKDVFIGSISMWNTKIQNLTFCQHIFRNYKFLVIHLPDQIHKNITDYVEKESFSIRRAELLKAIIFSYPSQNIDQSISKNAIKTRIVKRNKLSQSKKRPKKIEKIKIPQMIVNTPLTITESEAIESPSKRLSIGLRSPEKNYQSRNIDNGQTKRRASNRIKAYLFSSGFYNDDDYNSETENEHSTSYRKETSYENELVPSYDDEEEDVCDAVQSRDRNLYVPPPVPKNYNRDFEITNSQGKRRKVISSISALSTSATFSEHEKSNKRNNCNQVALKKPRSSSAENHHRHRKEKNSNEQQNYFDDYEGASKNNESMKTKNKNVSHRSKSCNNRIVNSQRNSHNEANNSHRRSNVDSANRNADSNKINSNRKSNVDITNRNVDFNATNNSRRSSNGNNRSKDSNKNTNSHRNSVNNKSAESNNRSYGNNTTNGNNRGAVNKRSTSSIGRIKTKKHSSSQSRSQSQPKSSTNRIKYKKEANEFASNVVFYTSDNEDNQIKPKRKQVNPVEYYRSVDEKLKEEITKENEISDSSLSFFDTNNRQIKKLSNEDDDIDVQHVFADSSSFDFGHKKAPKVSDSREQRKSNSEVKTNTQRSKTSKIESQNGCSDSNSKSKIKGNRSTNHKERNQSIKSEKPTSESHDISSEADLADSSDRKSEKNSVKGLRSSSNRKRRNSNGRRSQISNESEPASASLLNSDILNQSKKRTEEEKENIWNDLDAKKKAKKKRQADAVVSSDSAKNRRAESVNRKDGRRRNESESDEIKGDAKNSINYIKSVNSSGKKSKRRVESVQPHHYNKNEEK